MRMMGDKTRKKSVMKHFNVSKNMLSGEKFCETQKDICKTSQKFNLKQYKNLLFHSVYFRLFRSSSLTMHNTKLLKAKIIHAMFQLELEMICFTSRMIPLDGQYDLISAVSSL